MREKNRLFVLNYCTGLTWSMGTKSQKNPFQVCMSGGRAASRLATRFQALHDGSASRQLHLFWTEQ